MSVPKVVISLEDQSEVGRGHDECERQDFAVEVKAVSASVRFPNVLLI
jgi:hypothetical protein